MTTDDGKSLGKLAPSHDDPAGGRLIEATKRLTFEFLARLFDLVICEGGLRLTYRDRAAADIGNDDSSPLHVHVNDLGCLFKILRRPDLAIGETFVEGAWEVSDGDLARFLGLLLRNDARLESTLPVKTLNALRNGFDAVFRTNTNRRSRRNASHHYDIGNDLYRSFLDEEMLYSCAFYATETQSLGDAQKNKLKTTLDRLDIRPGMTVLDIGCGWGALTRALAERGAKAVGITLADQQLALAQERVPERYRNLITYHLQDYRDHAAENPETYDRVVSIGMFEHVGRRHFETYFTAIDTLLKPEGCALVHSIVKTTPSRTNAWVDKYIFPGGFIPQVVDMSQSATSAGLEATRAPFIHSGDNYARTLRHWRERFNANYDTLDQNLYDERFRRMWNFYLAGSEAAFDWLGFAVSQIVIRKPAIATSRSRPQRRLQPLRPIPRRKTGHSDVRDQGRNPHQG